MNSSSGFGIAPFSSVFSLSCLQKMQDNYFYFHFSVVVLNNFCLLHHYIFLFFIGNHQIPYSQKFNHNLMLDPMIFFVQ